MSNRLAVECGYLFVGVCYGPMRKLSSANERRAKDGDDLLRRCLLQIRQKRVSQQMFIPVESL